MASLTNNNTSLQEILAAVNALPEAGSGLDTSDATATAADILSGKTAYVNGSKVTGNIVTATQATPSITINASGLITASATQTAGYVVAGTKSATKQLAFQAAKTITPSATSQIAVSSGYYTGGNITVAGDSNLVAGNIKSGVSIFGVAGSYEGSGGGGDTSMEDAFVTRSFTSYTNDRVKTIGTYAFAYCSSLTTVSLPSCTSIGSNAFYSCTSLTTASFPLCISIGSNAFTYCFSLTTVSFPLCTSICNGAFYSCTSLTTASFPLCTSISTQAFFGCSSLTTVSFPLCTSIGNGAFYRCSSLTTASFPACKFIGSSAFYSCTSLTTVSFPACKSVGSSAFCSCTSLTTVSFPACKSIGSSAFYSCTSLASIYLMGSLVCALGTSQAFSRTKITTSSGSIYVPSSLVTSYKAATNWTYFSNRIFGA